MMLFHHDFIVLPEREKGTSFFLPVSASAALVEAILRGYADRMFRVIAHAFGQPEQALAYGPGERPDLDAGSVLVRMRASPINPSDLISVTGAYRHRTPLPFVPGFDGVGIVAEVGGDVDPAMSGKRVLPLGSAGNWQTWKAVPASWCVTVPDDFSDDQAATAYINPLTARLLMDALAPAPGARIGITAGASAIGRMLIRLLAAAGAQPIALVRSEASWDALRDEPAMVVFNGQALPELAGGLDAVGGPVGGRLAAAIRPGGLLLHYGLLSGQPLAGPVLAAARARIGLFRLRDWVHAAPREQLQAAMAETFAAIRTGHLASDIAAHYPLAAFRDALAHDARAGRRGKIILQP